MIHDELLFFLIFIFINRIQSLSAYQFKRKTTGKKYCNFFMSNKKFFELLIITSYIAIQWIASADNTVNGNESFGQRIKNLQDETNNLCSYIRETSLVTTKGFIRLIQDAHIHCPNLQELEVYLFNIATQADTHFSDINQQLSTCDSIVYMLTKSLDSGGLVDYHLKEGDYSLVTSTIDKWHQSFLNFKSDFHLKNIPLEIILNNKKSFFYDDWKTGIAKSIFTLITLAISSLFLLRVFTLIGLIGYITSLFCPSITNPHQDQSALARDITKRKLNTTSPVLTDLYLDNDNAEILSIASNYNKFFTNVTKIVWVTTLCVLTAITMLWYPSMISFSTSSRYNWYPAATTAIENMRSHRDEIQIIVLRQIGSIEELQSYVNMYLDQTIQENTNTLISNLATGIKFASKEISELYRASAQLPSAFRQAYTSIESKAKKAGRLTETNDLLVALNETSETYEKFQRSVQTLMINQQQLLPALKEQTKVMQMHVQQGHLLDIHQVAQEHIRTTMYIDESAYFVEITVKELINIVENGDGMKKAIQELKDETVLNQYKAMTYGALGGMSGTVGGAVLGTVAIKSGFAIVSVTATAIATPVAASVAGVGLLSLGAYSVITNFDQYNDASRYKTDLDSLENKRGNLHTAMKIVETAITVQREASGTTQTALNNIITHSASFSKIPGFVLPTEKRIALSNELLRIMQQYNTMSSIFESFKPYMTDKHQKHIA